MSTWGIVSFVVLAALTANSNGCPDGWANHQQSCYFFSQDKLSWTGAIVVCKLLGGYLVEVQNDLEKNFLHKTISQQDEHYWIGAHDAVKKGSFVWATSQEPVSDNVIVRSPDNSRNNERCVEIDNNGKWNHNDCMAVLQYVCERPANIEEMVG
ncbi:low affinity immunoglobulin epsilon Fc receptor-like [Argopecten irradians]|uniref:low affinity immunoglobulin epsilon Fc receptor-like n=1 Tax=Argopecten irradians TaxID=31199 RepID=UPI003716DDC2